MDCSGTPYYYLSKYRSALMGTAILYVMWFHSSIYLDFFKWDFLDSIFLFFKKTGYCGVDIFLLLSGMGIYNSLEKHETDIFMKNRLRRILPTWWGYMPLCILSGIFIFHVNYTRKQIAGFATLTGFWLDMENQGNWYVYAIMLFYLISPVLHSFLKNSKNKRLTFFVLIFISLAVSLVMINNKKLIVFSRIPVYITGMYISASMKEKKPTGSFRLLCLISLTAGFSALTVSYIFFSRYLWRFGLWWYPFILITFPLCLIIARVFDIISRRAGSVTKAFSFLGKESLELLLGSELVFNIFKQTGVTLFSRRLTAVIAFLLSVAAGTALYFCIAGTKKLAARIVQNIRLKRKQVR